MKSLNKALIVVFISLPVILGFFTKSYNKATKKDEVILVSTEKEKAIGASVARQVEKQYKDADDPLVQKRIEEIGARLAEACERKDITFRFKVLKAERDDYYNAFALPGGYVYIFDALLNKLESDDKIAAVLAHEVGHVAAKHSIKRLQESMGVNALLLLGVGMDTDAATFARAQDAITHLMASHSREAEIEADKLSVRYLKNSGFDPEGVVESLEMLQELRKKGPIRRYVYYRSHPYLSERLSMARIEVSGEMDFDSYINLSDEENNF